MLRQDGDYNPDADTKTLRDGHINEIHIYKKRQTVSAVLSRTAAVNALDRVIDISLDFVPLSHFSFSREHLVNSTPKIHFEHARRIRAVKEKNSSQHISHVDGDHFLFVEVAPDTPPVDG